MLKTKVTKTQELTIPDESTLELNLEQASLVVTFPEVANGTEVEAPVLNIEFPHFGYLVSLAGLAMGIDPNEAIFSPGMTMKMLGLTYSKLNGHSVRGEIASEKIESKGGISDFKRAYSLAEIMRFKTYGPNEVEAVDQSPEE